MSSNVKMESNPNHALEALYNMHFKGQNAYETTDDRVIVQVAANRFEELNEDLEKLKNNNDNTNRILYGVSLGWLADGAATLFTLTIGAVVASIVSIGMMIFGKGSEAAKKVFTEHLVKGIVPLHKNIEEGINARRQQRTKESKLIEKELETERKLLEAANVQIKGQKIYAPPYPLLNSEDKKAIKSILECDLAGTRSKTKLLDIYSKDREDLAQTLLTYGINSYAAARKVLKKPENLRSGKEKQFLEKFRSYFTVKESIMMQSTLSDQPQILRNKIKEQIGKVKKEWVDKVKKEWTKSSPASEPSFEQFSFAAQKRACREHASTTLWAAFQAGKKTYGDKWDELYADDAGRHLANRLIFLLLVPNDVSN